MKQAIVTTQYEILRGIFDKGDNIKIEIIRHAEDVMGTEQVFYEETDSLGRKHKKYKIVKVILAEKDSMKSWKVKSKNGHYYDESCFHSFIGYKSLGEIFTLVK